MTLIVRSISTPSMRTFSPWLQSFRTFSKIVRVYFCHPHKAIRSFPPRSTWRDMEPSLSYPLDRPLPLQGPAPRPPKIDPNLPAESTWQDMRQRLSLLHPSPTEPSIPTNPDLLEPIFNRIIQAITNACHIRALSENDTIVIHLQGTNPASLTIKAPLAEIRKRVEDQISESEFRKIIKSTLVFKPHQEHPHINNISLSY